MGFEKYQNSLHQEKIRKMTMTKRYDLKAKRINILPEYFEIKTGGTAALLAVSSLEFKQMTIQK